MAPRTTLELTRPGSEQASQSISVPSLALPQVNGLGSELAKVEKSTHLHIAVMHAHERKADAFIEVNLSIANKSTEAFSDYARSSEIRVKEAENMMFAKDVELVEHHFRQSVFDGLSANARDMMRQTGMVATMSVLPAEEPKRGFFARLFGS